MQRLTDRIMAHAGGLPEGAAVSAKELLHLGNRVAIDQALSRLAERGRLIRARRGVYVCPVTGRFGTRAPSVEQAVQAFARLRVRSSFRVELLRLTAFASLRRCLFDWSI
jgi:hypothetical protein